MRHRRLGKTGFEVSEIGMGCWQLGGDFGPVADDMAQDILATAADAGVNFWDTADVYGGGLSETRIGAYLNSGHKAIVATKVGRDGSLFPDSFTKQGVRASLEGSLKRLGVDALNLVQIHCVPRPVLERGELFGWLDDFVQDGIIQHYGASVETVAEGQICLKHPGISTLQIIFNLFRQDAAAQLLPAAHKADVGVIVRLPLASGLLSGKFGKGHKFDASDHRNYNRDGAAFSVGETFSGIEFDRGVDLVAQLEGLAPKGWPLSHLALRWILDHPAVSTVIAGVSNPSQLRGNIEAAERPSLSQTQMDALSAFYLADVKQHIRCEI